MISSQIDNQMELEEKKKSLYMVYHVLKEKFNRNQWEIISENSSNSFLKLQEGILKNLLKNKNLYDQYFYQFYTNHTKLLHWSILSTQHKAEIEDYVFKRLVNNGITFYNEKIKEAFQNKSFKHTSSSAGKVSHIQLKTMKDEVYRQFFKDVLNRNKQTSKQLNLKLYGGKNEVKDQSGIDGHQFYIKTFNACNGWKYIFYNYEKHMKGLSEKGKYNNVIRLRKQNKTSSDGISDKFMPKKSMEMLQFSREEGKCSIYSMNRFLNDESLNSGKGFKSIALDKTIKKVVFVNHQGKPLTYRISRPQK